MRISIFVLLCLLVNTSHSRPKYYKWTDENGNTHYSEKKPKNMETQEIKVYTSTPGQKAEEKKDEQQENEKPADQQAVDKYNKEQQDIAQQAQNEANCKIAKANLQTLQNQIRIKRVDPVTGKEIYMDQESIKKMIEKTKQSIQEYCK